MTAEFQPQPLSTGRTDGGIPVAIQLYSLRDVIAEDVPGTLAKLAGMGYAGVEFAGDYGLPAETLRSMLDDKGLRCAGAHLRLEQLEGEAFERTAAAQKILGNDRLIIPGAPLDDLDDTIRRMNQVHAAAKQMGLRAGYHNHTKEFQSRDGVIPFERIFAETPSDFLVQVDIGWAAAAGQDVQGILRRYAQRIETVHIKEFNPEDPAAAVGQGIIDWTTIMDLLESETAVAWYVVEQEQYRVGPMESVRDCIDHIRRIRC